MSEKHFGNILAVDTATNTLRVAIQYGGDRLVKWSGEVEKSHGQMLMKRIGELMETAGLKPTDLDGFVVCIGPGSFTGLRIGLAAIKGMVMALDIPTAAVTSFEIAAQRLGSVDCAVTVVTPLNRDEGIAGLVDNGRCDEATIRVVRYESLLAEVGGGALAGMGLNLTEKYPEIPNEDYTDRLDYDAADLLHLGRARLERGQTVDIARLEPLYLQKSQAEIRFEQREQNT